MNQVLCLFLYELKLVCGKWSKICANEPKSKDSGCHKCCIL